MTEKLSGDSNASHIDVGGWRFSPDAKTLTPRAGGGAVHLEDKVADLLMLLLARAGEVVSRDDILETVWGGRSLSEQSVPVAISKLRKALGDDAGEHRIIETVPKRGYRLVPEVPADDQTAARRRRFLPISLVAAALALMVVFWPSKAPLSPPVIANKPGIILTFKDLRTAGGAEDQRRVIALSELASYYLAQVPEVLVIRHWWNFDAPDPTGGIFTRYGADTPVYLLTGTLIDGGGGTVAGESGRVVTLFVSKPQTDEVIWSGIYPVDAGTAAYFEMLGEMFTSIGVQVPEAVAATAPLSSLSDDVRYWRGRYMAQLSMRSAADAALADWLALLAEKPDDIAARRALAALKARWPDVAVPEGVADGAQAAQSGDGGPAAVDPFRFVNLATIAFYHNRNPDDALRLIDQALASAPGDHHALSLQGEIRDALGDREGAVESYRKAVRMAPFARAYDTRLAELEGAQLLPQD